MLKRKGSRSEGGDMGRRSLGDFIQRSFACRDVWAAEVGEDGDGIRDTGYARFKHWVMEAFSRPEPPPAVIEFVKLLVAPNDPSGYSKDTLKALLESRHNDRDYRVVVGADAGNGDQDFRVRHFMEGLIDHKQKSDSKAGSSMSAWICPFFCTRKCIPTPRTKAPLHATQPCSRFEQMLFLAAVARLSWIINQRRGTKRMKMDTGRSQSVVLLPSLKALNGITAQRLGYGIQTLVYGWDTFARGLRFESVEAMVMPYSRITGGSPMMYEVISDREMGFVPSSQRLSFQVDVELTTRREETFPEAFDRETVLDHNIRALVSEFFQDFYAVIQADALYGEEKWSHLEDYADSGAGMPARFDRLPANVVETVASGMKSARRAIAVKVAVPSVIGDEDPDVEHGSPVGGAQNSTMQEAALSFPVVGDEELRMHMDTVRKAMGEKWKMLACSFDDLLEAHEQLFPREELGGQVQFILTDPPYNIRRDNGSKNASYDTLMVQQMTSVVDVFHDLLKPGGHGILFCTAQQFPLWEQKFKKHGSESFVVDKVPVVFAWHPAVYKVFPGRRSCALQNCVEFAVHVRKKGLSQEQEEELVNYQNFNYVGSDYAGHKNVISKIWGLRPGEQLRVTVEGAPRPTALRNEQKPLALLRELISRFTQPGDVVVDLFGGTFSTCTASFSLERHRLFVGCELDKFCFDNAQQHCIKLFAEVIAEGNTDIVVSEDVNHAALQVVRAMKVKKVNTEIKWMAPKGLPQYQALPEKLLSYIACKSEDPSFYFAYKGRGVHEWPRTFQGILQEADPAVLRSIDATACDVMIGKSRIKCRKAGLGVFAAKTFAPGDVIGPFYGTLVYHNLLKRKEVHKTYGEGILGATAGRFRSYAIQVPVQGANFNDVRDLMDGRKAVSIVPAPFCAMGFVNDYRYHPEDEEFDSDENKRTANAHFVNEKYPIKSRQQLVNPFTQVVQAKAYINPGEEIYLNYGNTYEVFVQNCR